MHLLGALEAGNLQIPGHVKLRQYTGSRQLLVHGKLPCMISGSCQLSSMHRQHTAVAASDAMHAHQQPAAVRSSQISLHRSHAAAAALASTSPTTAAIAPGQCRKAECYTGSSHSSRRLSGLEGSSSRHTQVVYGIPSGSLVSSTSTDEAGEQPTHEGQEQQQQPKQLVPAAPLLRAAAATAGNGGSTRTARPRSNSRSPSSQIAGTEQQPVKQPVAMGAESCRTTSSSSSSNHSAPSSNGSVAEPSAAAGAAVPNSSSSRQRGTTSNSSSEATSQQQQQPVQDAQGVQAPGDSSEQQPTQHEQQQQPVQQQQQAVQQPAVFDPSALPIADRVKLLRNRIAARQHRGGRYIIPGKAMSAGELGLHVCSACAAAGIAGRAVGCILDHVLHSRVSGHPESLPAFLAAYRRLESHYGQAVVLEWLRRAPSVIRNDTEVPVRLLQLSKLLDGAPLAEVLALTRRCPAVLGVEAALLTPRLRGICDMLRRPMDTEGSKILAAAPTLLAMQPDTLAVKVQRLEALAAMNPKWAQAYARCPSKSLAMLLTYSLQRQMRLVYLAQQGLDGRELSMTTVMSFSKDKMQQYYPGFGAWCQQQEQLLPGLELEQQD